MNFQVLTVTSMEMVVSWVATPFNMVEVYKRFAGIWRLCYQGDCIVIFAMHSVDKIWSYRTITFTDFISRSTSVLATNGVSVFMILINMGIKIYWTQQNKSTSTVQ